MRRNRTFFLSVAILAFSFPLLVGVHLSKTELQRVLRTSNRETNFRFKRQLIIDPQPFLSPLVTNRVLQVPIPTNIAFFPGGGQPADQCSRDETLMEDGSCQNLLTTGNCGSQEEVLIDPQTNRGFCAPRICPPDRVFLPLTQLCHDPRDANVCPPGRELYYSAFGTPVCTCPDGTVEGDDDLDDDVCEPILGTTLQCTAGMYEYESMPVNYNLPTYTKHDVSQDSISSSYSADLREYYEPKVFWFKDFNSPPMCLPDPCNGTNLKRGPNDLPFVPNEKGKCFQLGQTEGACPYGKIYILNLEKLKGECTTLEDAGYNIFDPKVLETLKKMFGPIITENRGPPFKSTYGVYGPPSNNLNGVTSEINTNYPSSISSRPISNYQTPSTTSSQIIKNIQEHQNSIDAFINGFISPLDQNNAGKISHSTPGAQPSSQTHHQFVLGSTGISGTKKTEIYPAINLTNLLNTFNQNKGQNVQGSFISQVTHSPHQKPFSLQPITPSISLRPSTQYISHSNLLNQNNEGPIIHQSTQIPFTSIISQKPFLQSTFTNPVSQVNALHVSPNVINPFINNEGYKKQTSARPFTSTSSVINIQKPGLGQGNQGKEICTFVQNPNGQGGKKVCQFVNAGQQPFNSFEMNGQVGHNSPEILPGGGGGQMPPVSFELFNGRGFESYGYRFGRSLGFKQPPQAGLLTHHLSVRPTGEVVTHLQPLSRHRREIERDNILNDQNTEDGDNSVAAKKVQSRRKRNLLPYTSPSNVSETRLLRCRPGSARGLNGKCIIKKLDRDNILNDQNTEDGAHSVATSKVLSRRKRNLLPYASPSNVFETRLLSCRPGAARDINGKCRNKVLPARIPQRRGTRAAPPVPPTPSCPSGMAFNIRRMCVPATTAQNSLVAFNLG